MKMKKVLLVCITIFIILAILSFIANYVDKGRVSTGHEPKFTIKIVSDSGNKVTYWGLGYKVVRYPSVSPNEPYKNNRGVKMGSWFMKYDLPKEEENQILTLSFELNNKTYTYNIEYDSEQNIVKVDNTDYYEFLEDGELITDVRILDTELTDYFIRNGGSSKK